MDDADDLDDFLMLVDKEIRVLCLCCIKLFCVHSVVINVSRSRKPESLKPKPETLNPKPLNPKTLNPNP